MPYHIKGPRPGYLPSINMIIILSFFLIICGLSGIRSAQAFDCSSVTEIPIEECEALVAIYDSTGGDNWFNNTVWLQNDTLCDCYETTPLF